MKKSILISALSLMFLLSATACGSSENNQTSETTTEARKIYINEESVTTEPDFDIVEMNDIQQLIDSFDNDPAVIDKMYYEVYAEKVMVNGSDFDKDGDNIQVVVMCRVENIEDKSQRYKTIAAEKDFYDATITDKPEVESRTIWKFIENDEYYAWSAESIINSALDYMNMSEDDMEMYKRYIIKTTFPE